MASMRLCVAAAVLVVLVLAAGQEAHAARLSSMPAMPIPKNMISCTVLGNCEKPELHRPPQQANKWTRGCKAADRCRD